MADTPRTKAYLLASEFQDGQSAGISAQDIRDFISSVPFIDDPANSQSLGAPAILRGTINAEYVTGVTVGAGQSTGTRQATATALQAAWASAVANGQFFEIPPNIYEIDTTTSLVVENRNYSNQLVWKGTPMSRIIQYNAAGSGTPVLTIGDLGGNTYSMNIMIDGVSCEYGGSVAGLTNTANIVISSIVSSSVSKVRAGAGSNVNPAYYGCRFIGGVPAFSCSFNDWGVNGAQQDMIHINAISTGNVADNWYCNMSNGTLGGYYLFMADSGFWEGLDFRRVNFEWGTCNIMVFCQYMTGQRFGSVHLEGIVFTGADPILFRKNGNSLSIDLLDIQNCRFATADGASGTASLIWDYAPSQAGGAGSKAGGTTHIVSLNIANQTASQVTIPIWLFNPIGMPGSGVIAASIDKCQMRDEAGGNYDTRIGIDPHMPTANFATPRQFNRYDYGLTGSNVTSSVLDVAAAYTHYGQHQDATLVLAATGTYNVTLSNLLGASGTQTPDLKNRVNVIRPAYTSGTVRMLNGAGATLTTNAATTTTPLCYSYNGTQYVAVTPVT